MEDLTVALVQMQSSVGQMNQNLQKIAQYTAQAKNQHADIICFPEMSITGYDLQYSALYAESLQDDSAKTLCELAQHYQLTIIAGMAERAPAGKPYITQLTATKDGKLAAYCKTHLGHYEQRNFQAGNLLQVAHTEHAVIGTALCWEMHFPEIATTMALEGCEIIFAPHASPEAAGDRKALWMRYMPARAYDNNLYVVVCNQVGDNGHGLIFGGGLLVLDPKGNILLEDFSQKETMRLLKLEAQYINRLRSNTERTTMRDTFFLKSRRPALYRI